MCQTLNYYFQFLLRVAIDWVQIGFRFVVLIDLQSVPIVFQRVDAALALQLLSDYAVFLNEVDER
jgi:hypothetical protein